MSRRNKRWTEQEINALALLWGTRSVESIAKTLERSPWAVSRKAGDLRFTRADRRDTRSLREFSEYSGYTCEKILKAARKLHLRIELVRFGVPGSTRKTYAFTEEQQEKILELMLSRDSLYADLPGSKKTTQGAWGVGTKPSCCSRCGTAERPHCARGMCRSCYNMKWKRKKNEAHPMVRASIEHQEGAEHRRAHSGVPDGEDRAQLPSPASMAS